VNSIGGGEAPTQVSSASDAQAAEEPTQDRKPEFNIGNAVDDLRQLIAEADAFANAADELYEEVGNDRRRRERLAYLVTAAADAVRAALEAVDELRRRMGA
jgi:hypothetical protein